MRSSNVTTNVRNCARCGDDHDGLTFTPFTHPIHEMGGGCWSHWCMCPVLNEPILLETAPSPPEPPDPEGFDAE